MPCGPMNVVPMKVMPMKVTPTFGKCAEGLVRTPGRGGPKVAKLKGKGAESDLDSQFSGQQQAAPGSHPAAPRPKLAGWHLVWCHDRCHKKENEQLCHELRESLHALGGSLICLKKADQFAFWLQKQKTPQANVLVTDWREAQSCAGLLWQGLRTGSIPVGRQPLGIVVLCANSKQHGRASQWVRSLPPSPCLILAVDISGDPPAALGEPLRSLIYKHFGGVPTTGQPAARGAKPAAQAAGAAHGPSHPHFESEGTERSQPTFESERSQPHFESDGTESLPKGLHTPPTTAWDSAASESEEHHQDIVAKITEEEVYGTVFSGAPHSAYVHGIPFMEHADDPVEPDVNLTSVLWQYGTVEGSSIPIEHIYENVRRIRL